MEKIIYQYEVSRTANNKVNLLSLHMEMKLSTVNSYIDVHMAGLNEFHCCFSETLTAAQKTEIETIIGNHTGVVSNVDEINVNKRENLIREIVEISILHLIMPFILSLME
jgi:hypothetical protein